MDVKKADDNIQQPLLWASLQRKGIHGKMLAGIQSSNDGGDMSMKMSGSSASGTAGSGKVDPWIPLYLAFSLTR